MHNLARIQSRLPIFPIWEGLLATFVIFLLQTNPLLGAFAYESSLVLSGFLSLTVTFGLTLRLHQIRRTRPLAVNDVAFSFFYVLSLLVFSLSLLVLGSFRIPVCRWDTGLNWFLLLPVVSSFFGLACAHWGLHRSKSLKGALFFAYLPHLLFAFLTIHDLLFHPQLSFLNPTFGYYAGPLYDEWIPITREVVTFRLWTAILSLWLILWAWHRHQSLMLRLLGLGILAVLLFRSPLGWFHSTSNLQEKLGGHRAGSSLDLYYDQNSFSAQETQTWIGSLEFYVKVIQRELKIAPAEMIRPSVYLYKNAEQKSQLTGVRRTAIGNPIQHAVHLPPGARPSDSLVKHELVHVFAAPYGIPLLGLTFRIGLLEGLATALEKVRRDLTVHEWARAMMHFSLLPNIENVMHPTGFWSESPSRAYLAAGSFCRWLIDHYGINRLKKLYRGQGFRETYGADVTTLESRWRAHLERIRLSPSALALAEPILQRRSIFDRRCPHDVADQLHAAYRCKEKIQKTEALKKFEKAWIYSGKSVPQELRLARERIRLGEWKKALPHLSSLRRKASLPDVYQAAISFLDGDAHLLQNQVDKATAIYKILNPPPTLPHMHWEKELRLALLNEKMIGELQSYVENGFSNEWMKSMAKKIRPASSPGIYMLAIDWNQDRKKWKKAQNWIDMFGQARPRRHLEAFLKMYALQLENAGQYSKAGNVYQSLVSKSSTLGARLSSREQMMRLRFVSSFSR